MRVKGEQSAEGKGESREGERTLSHGFWMTSNRGQDFKRVSRSRLKVVRAVSTCFTEKYPGKEPYLCYINSENGASGYPYWVLDKHKF